MAEVVDIAARIAPYFPLGGRPFSLEVVPGATGQWVSTTEPAAVAAIRLVVWDIDDAGVESIRDVKEQEVHMGWPVSYDNEARVAAFFAACAKLIDLIGQTATEFDSLMPADLIHIDALGLARANTAEEFEAALRAKGRLGRLLG
ncbi:DNA-directed RNA polymerase beta subunit [Enhygromyxa salina]|uniref:DNA-directed RNA polymerase beta subunit n=1 Tax=Enhygromyxa salina TaxID=215803 RepID=A0A0C2CU19_9BACT|nr:hypothetical protein [Enhygromyxa salina]KIG13110.1 DNA-directed RNA polymerase beta subunit [Enhygromyxa salina]